MDRDEVPPRRNYEHYGSNPPHSGKPPHSVDDMSADDAFQNGTDGESSTSSQISSLSLHQNASDTTQDERLANLPNAQVFDTVDATLSRATVELIGLLKLEAWCQEFKAKLTPGYGSHVGEPQTVHGTFESIRELWRLCSESIRRAPVTFTSIHANSRPSSMLDPVPKSTDSSFNDKTQKQTLGSVTAKRPGLPPKPATMRSSKDTQGQVVEETEDDTPMEFTSTTYEYVEKFMQQELKTITSQCGVNLHPELKSDGYNARIYVEAVHSKSDTSGAKQQLAVLFREVSQFMSEARFEVPPDVEGEIFQLNTREKKILILMENHTCVIMGRQQDVDRAEAEVKTLMKGQPKGKKQASHFGFTYSLPHGHRVEVIKGDITQQNVDVIVNAANGRLEHAGGVARAICKAGGEEIEQQSKSLIHRHGWINEAEVVYTKGGKMKCKYVVHTVPPQWDVHRRRPEDLTRILKQACENSLELASAKLKASSIAIPGLGSGVFGIPKDVCARALMTAASNFFLQYGKKSPLKHIIFIDIDPSTVQAMKDQYSQVFYGTGFHLK